MIALVVSQFGRGQLPTRALPVAVLALELSGNPSEGEALLAGAGETLRSLVEALPEDAVLRPLPNGVVVALVSAGSLAESAAAAARAAAAVDARAPQLEQRLGIAVGLVDGGDPLQSAVVALAARLARAGQAGQTLCGYGAARLLDRDWQFAPVGPLPRRAEDAVDCATACLGRKPPAPTPSAFATDQGTDLIGRRVELNVLDEELARTRAGEGHWCVVVAPAGGGKSKLLRTWLGRLDPDVRVVGAAATAFGQAPRALVDQLLDSLEAPLPADAPSEQASRALAAALERAARDRPLLVLVDDLHWTDSESLAILREVSEPPLSCLIVVALRSSFASAVPWLFKRAQRLELLALSRDERDELLRRVLPDEIPGAVREQLADADHGRNPLYLEQAAAYLREVGPDAPLPRSLHEAVLRRLEFLRVRIDRRGYERPSPKELAVIERTVGEWLDRLEMEDYESREAIAEYLSLLEQIDSALVIAASLAGLPIRRNRRLAAAIERFYSASFAERAAAIEHLAERDRPNAAYAATRGGERALAALRLEDATGYFGLAARLSEGEEQARHLLALGDVLLAHGLPGKAWHAYASARRATASDAFRARCDRRLGHAALVHEHPRLADQLIERALPRLPDDERLLADCDRLVARASDGRLAVATDAVRLLDKAADTAELKALLYRTRLRLALLGGPGDREQLARACAAALTLEGEPVGALGALIETTLLLLEAAPALVGSELLDEAAHAARRLALDNQLSALNLAAAG